jgi:hypothetical protein
MSFYGRHGAPLPAPSHSTISQYVGRLFYAAALLVGHHGSRDRPFRSRRVEGLLLLLWVVFYVGIRRLHTTKSANSPEEGGRASAPVSEPSARQPSPQIGGSAASTGQVHCEGTMCGGGGGDERGRGGVGAISTTAGKKNRLIMMVAVVLRPPWGPAPGAEAYNNQQIYYATGRRY